MLLVRSLLLVPYVYIAPPRHPLSGELSMLKQLPVARVTHILGKSNTERGLQCLLYTRPRG